MGIATMDQQKDNISRIQIFFFFVILVVTLNSVKETGKFNFKILFNPVVRLNITENVLFNPMSPKYYHFNLQSK